PGRGGCRRRVGAGVRHRRGRPPGRAGRRVGATDRHRRQRARHRLPPRAGAALARRRLGRRAAVRGAARRGAGAVAVPGPQPGDRRAGRRRGRRRVAPAGRVAAHGRRGRSTGRRGHGRARFGPQPGGGGHERAAGRGVSAGVLRRRRARGAGTHRRAPVVRVRPARPALAGRPAGARRGGVATGDARPGGAADGSRGGRAGGSARPAGRLRLGRPPRRLVRAGGGGAPVSPRRAGAATGRGGLTSVAAVAWHLDEFARSLTSVAPSTVEAYLRDLRGFTTWAGRLGLDGPEGVERQTLRRYLAYLATRGTARRTIARRASTLRRYFRWLLRTGRVAVDPTAGLAAPKGEARLPRVLRPDELRHLLGDDGAGDAPTAAAAAGHDPVAGAVELRDRALVELLYGSGLRIAEATALDVDDLDL